MGSITSLSGRSASHGSGERDGSPVMADDPLETIDEHTRQLLGRRTGARRDRVWMLAGQLAGLRRGDGRTPLRAIRDDVRAALPLLTLAAWLVLVISRLAGSPRPGVLVVAGLWMIAVVTVPAARALVRVACRRATGYAQNTVIVGAGEVGQLICHELLDHPEYGANVVGFVDRAPMMRREDLPERLSVLGAPDRLPEIIERLGVERVVISFSREPVSELLALVRRLQSTNVQIDLVPRLFELVGSRASLNSVAGVPLIRLRPSRRPTLSRILKRGLDIVGAALALVVLSPLMAYVAARIRRDSPGPVLVRQTRLGPGAVEFTALNFRTTRTADDPSGESGRPSMSITPVLTADGLYSLVPAEAVTDTGQWLRRTGLDELPQLLNVLRGDIPLSAVRRHAMR